MTQVQDTKVVTVLHPICCGLDVHKKFVTACLIISDATTERSVLETFGTFTDDLIRLREWLLEYECPVVALESTGVYWKPVHNILEGHLAVVLVNARHIKNLPGRKTDMSDCQWIATLLRVGFLRASFIPPKIVRQWRDLTRYRRSLVEALGDVKRQVHKLLECINIKIDSVVPDLFGRTGRNLIETFAQRQSRNHLGRSAKLSQRQTQVQIHRAVSCGPRLLRRASSMDVAGNDRPRSPARSEAC